MGHSVNTALQYIKKDWIKKYIVKLLSNYNIYIYINDTTPHKIK
jgi:hypothetical protein